MVTIPINKSFLVSVNRPPQLFISMGHANRRESDSGDLSLGGSDLREIDKLQREHQLLPLLYC